jgi:hypothetical protein
MSRKARVRLVSDVEYLEDYNEAWAEMPKLVDEFGADSEEFHEHKRYLKNGIPVDTEEEAKSKVRSKIESTFRNTSETIESIEVQEKTGNVYRVESIVRLDNITPGAGLSPNERMERLLEQSFTEYRII